MWIAREGDLLLICTEASSLKGKNAVRDSRVATSIVDFQDPYVEVQMRGRVIERRRLKVRIDGKEGWLHSQEDLDALGMPSEQ